MWDYILQAFLIVACMLITGSNEAHAWELQKLTIDLTSSHSFLLVFSFCPPTPLHKPEAKCTSQGSRRKLTEFHSNKVRKIL